MDLANVAIAIEPARLQELEEGPHVTTAIFGHDDLGVRKLANDRRGERFASSSVVTIGSKGMVRRFRTLAISGQVSS